MEDITQLLQLTVPGRNAWLTTHMSCDLLSLVASEPLVDVCLQVGAGPLAFRERSILQSRLEHHLRSQSKPVTALNQVQALLTALLELTGATLVVVLVSALTGEVTCCSPTNRARGAVPVFFCFLVSHEGTEPWHLVQMDAPSSFVVDAASPGFSAAVRAVPNDLRCLERFLPAA